MINHLLQHYIKITTLDLINNWRKKDEPMDSSQPINVYFKCIDECIQFAADAETGAVYTPEQILQTTYYEISSSNIYTDACKEWRRKTKNG